MGRGVVDGREKENVPFFGDAGGGVSEGDALRDAQHSLLSTALLIADRDFRSSLPTADCPLSVFFPVVLLSVV